ncbi:MAG: NAD(P)H-dependent oxidoreductase subunit E [Bacillota bacterium]
MANGQSIELIDEIIRKNGGRRENILGMLLDLQAASPDNFVDRETAALLADRLKMSETRVYELIAFYAMLNTKPQARYILEVCNSSPCRFTKSALVAAALERLLGVKLGESTSDGLFAYHYVPCVGACDIGPVIKVRDTVFGNLDDEKIARLIDGLRDGSVRV